MPVTKRSADKLSVLIDNELDEWEEPEIIQALKNDDDLKSRWANYHLIGDAIRGALPPYVDTGLPDRVATALEQEPAFLRPNTIDKSETDHENTPIPAHTQIPRQTPRTNPSIGFALAASISAVAVFGMMEIDRYVGIGAGDATTVAAAEEEVTFAAAEGPAVVYGEGDTAVVMSAAYNYDESEAARSVTSVADQRPVADDLYDYLVNYHQYAAASEGSEGMLSYIRTASY